MCQSGSRRYSTVPSCFARVDYTQQFVRRSQPHKRAISRCVQRGAEAISAAQAASGIARGTATGIVPAATRVSLNTLFCLKISASKVQSGVDALPLR